MKCACAVLYCLWPVQLYRIFPHYHIQSFLIHRNSTILIHVGKARVNVSVRCLVLVKTYGNNPKKLFVKIIRKNNVMMNEFPVFAFPFLRIVFISWCSLFINPYPANVKNMVSF
jgi:hypothetical protein